VRAANRELCTKGLHPTWPVAGMMHSLRLPCPIRPEPGCDCDVDLLSSRLTHPRSNRGDSEGATRCTQPTCEGRLHIDATHAAMTLRSVAPKTYHRRRQRLYAAGVRFFRSTTETTHALDAKFEANYALRRMVRKSNAELLQ